MNSATFHDLDGASVFITGGGSGIGADGDSGAFIRIASSTTCARTDAAAARAGKPPSRTVACAVGLASGVRLVSGIIGGIDRAN